MINSDQKQNQRPAFSPANREGPPGAGWWVPDNIYLQGVRGTARAGGDAVPFAPSDEQSSKIRFRLRACPWSVCTEESRAPTVFVTVHPKPGSGF